MIDARRRIETAGLVVVLLLVGAFLVSFVLGVVHKSPKDETEAVPAATLPKPPAGSKGRVEVLNASGKSGLARAATMELRDAGFDVVYFGSTSRANRDSSVVIDRVGKRDVADAAAAALGVTTIRTQRDSTLMLDATVIVGTDWRRKQAAEQQEIQKGWKARLKKWVAPR